MDRSMRNIIIDSGAIFVPGIVATGDDSMQREEVKGVLRFMRPIPSGRSAGVVIRNV